MYNYKAESMKKIYIVTIVFALIVVFCIGYIYRKSFYAIRNRIPSIIADEAIQAVVATIVNIPILLKIYRKNGRSPKLFTPAIASVCIDLDHILQAGTLDPKLILREIHRFPTHSLTFAAFLGLLIYFVFRNLEIAWMVSSGISAHLLFDAATGGEIKLLYPFLTINANDPAQKIPLNFLAVIYVIMFIATFLISRREKTKIRFNRIYGRSRRYISKQGLASILIPLFVRLFMELTTPYPIGYESTIYAAMIKARAVLEEQVTGLITGEIGLLDLIFNATLPNFLFNFISIILGLDGIITIKLVAVLIAGFVGYASYRFARRYLQLPRTPSLMASIIATLYPMGFRVLWDFHRNAIAVGFILLSFSYLREPKFKTFVASLILAIIASLSHQFVALLAVSTFVTYLFYLILKAKKWGRAASLALALVPIAFIAYIYLILYSGGYLKMWNSVMHFKSFFYSYPFTETDVKVATFMLYLLYLPLIILIGRKGYKNDPILTTWLIFITTIWFSGVISVEALPYPHRWTYMAIYPLAMYAARRFSMLNLEKQKRALKITIGALLTFHLVWFASGIFILPKVRYIGNSYLIAFSVTLPGSTYYSSIPIQYCPDLEELLKNFDGSFERIGAHRCIFFLAYSLYDGDVEMVYNGLGIGIPYKHTLKDAVIWFSPGASEDLFWWYEIPESLEVHLEKGGMAIYRYKG